MVSWLYKPHPGFTLVRAHSGFSAHEVRSFADGQCLARRGVGTRLAVLLASLLPPTRGSQAAHCELKIRAQAARTPLLREEAHAAATTAVGLEAQCAHEPVEQAARVRAAYVILATRRAIRKVAPLRCRVLRCAWWSDARRHSLSIERCAFRSKCIARVSTEENRHMARRCCCKLVRARGSVRCFTIRKHSDRRYRAACGWWNSGCS